MVSRRSSVVESFVDSGTFSIDGIKSILVRGRGRYPRGSTQAGGVTRVLEHTWVVLSRNPFGMSRV